eukprot:CAMPEP_0113559850 /NCGR_PEP_ID=MMETSP0015_2-20120614/19117_1 /TAXON_ID=2838 /ORGANISM="Odontella" /LENGTH=546 /DNA_ID=CAMNT_0000461515 /DNA_START=91 /DNA_END=1728 /DNA_ORIENTATION=+ /assembly_acc=CAM_ASM_000160
MVEGHSVHRIASRFGRDLIGKQFAASSPNGRFLEGSKAIDGMIMSNIEAVGKNLFAFFSPPVVASSTPKDQWDDSVVVVHVHFGMSGAWSVHSADEEPETKSTTRLRLVEQCASTLEQNKLSTHLSAMTCKHGGYELYRGKRAALGHDPLRSDADPDELYQKVIKSKKSIGKLLMDQSYFAGPGNIFRAEILFLAGIHPETPGNELDKVSFSRVWESSVELLRRGYDTGSILTVNAEVDPDVAARGERRYIYNKSHCARCHGPVRSWDMAGRTCYVCSGGCQSRQSTKAIEIGEVSFAKGSNGCSSNTITTKNPKQQKKKTIKEEEQERSQHVPFVSHCARDGKEKRLSQQGPAGLTIDEIRSQILTLGGEKYLPRKSARKAQHIEALSNLLAGEEAKKEGESLNALTIAEIRLRIQTLSGQESLPPKRAKRDVHVETLMKLLSGENERNEAPVRPFLISSLPPPMVSAEEAAREKAKAGEHRGVEHIAELSRDQAIKAAVVTPLAEEDEQGHLNARKCAETVDSTGLSRNQRRSKRKRKLRFDSI